MYFAKLQQLAKAFDNFRFMEINILSYQGHLLTSILAASTYQQKEHTMNFLIAYRSFTKKANIVHPKVKIIQIFQ